MITVNLKTYAEVVKGSQRLEEGLDSFSTIADLYKPDQAANRIAGETFAVAGNGLQRPEGMLDFLEEKVNLLIEDEVTSSVEDLLSDSDFLESYDSQVVAPAGRLNRQTVLKTVLAASVVVGIAVLAKMSLDNHAQAEREAERALNLAQNSWLFKGYYQGLADQAVAFANSWSSYSPF